ncbi:MAG: SPOR domain-containing protein [Spongiibacteraceae bacterium]|nr:SPOR domain-containing protein [Spongiibacteraceae bacterium]
MSDGFKQRLVGAIVLGSVVLILWPVVFSDATGPVVDRRSQIPTPPPFEKYTVPQPTRPANVEPIREDGVQNEQEWVNSTPVVIEQPEPINKPKPKKQVNELPKLDKKGLPVSWVLQVASFSKQANAQDLKENLQKKGYKAYTRRIKTKSGESVRVYVGPKFTKAAFAKDKKVIDKAFKVKSLILRFRQ